MSGLCTTDELLMSVSRYIKQMIRAHHKTERLGHDFSLREHEGEVKT
jgi:hypothetical protein